MPTFEHESLGGLISVLFRHQSSYLQMSITESLPAVLPNIGSKYQGILMPTLAPEVIWAPVVTVSRGSFGPGAPGSLARRVISGVLDRRYLHGGP